eukprot:5929165-Pyramimonas_sp.AAC.1
MSLLVDVVLQLLPIPIGTTFTANVAAEANSQLAAAAAARDVLRDLAPRLPPLLLQPTAQEHVLSQQARTDVPISVLRSARLRRAPP